MMPTLPQYSPEFLKFQENWNNSFKDLFPILDILHSYPNQLKELKISDLITSQELNQYQDDWVRIQSKFEGIEKDFFQPYWVPLQKESYEFFIDLSDSSYPIFEFQFQIYRPYKYVRMNFFLGINDLIFAIENGENMGILKNRFEAEWLAFHMRKCR